MTVIPHTSRWAALSATEAQRLIARDPVLLLPTAAVEQHGPHLPLSTDVDIGEGLVAEALGQLGDEVPVSVLPTLAVGASDEHLAIAGTLSVSAETMIANVVGIGASLAGAGVKRLVLANSHGGNRAALDIAALRLRRDHGLLVVKAHWFRFPQPDGVVLPPAEWRHGLHGGAVETAMMLHLHPDAVRQDAVSNFLSFGTELDERLDVLNAEGSAGFAWEARDLNAAGVTGDARLATAEMGQRLIQSYASVLAAVIRDARAFPLERLAR